LKFHPREVSFKGFDEPQRVWHVLYPGMMKLLRDKQTKTNELISPQSTAAQVVKKVLFG
jgi:hypothetical protein